MELLMKRDMTLVREVLLAIEADSDEPGPMNLEIEGFSPEEVSYHVKIMADAGLLEAIDASTQEDFSWAPTALTWQGHEFLDAVRNETVWQKTKQLVAEKGGSVPFEVLKALAVKIAGSLFGLNC
jgi:hypothetical protein